MSTPDGVEAPSVGPHIITAQEIEALRRGELPPGVYLATETVQL